MVKVIVMSFLLLRDCSCQPLFETFNGDIAMKGLLDLNNCARCVAVTVCNAINTMRSLDRDLI